MAPKDIWEVAFCGKAEDAIDSYITISWQVCRRLNNDQLKAGLAIE
jgi:hypothetical protein